VSVQGLQTTQNTDQNTYAFIDAVQIIEIPGLAISLSGLLDSYSACLVLLIERGALGLASLSDGGEGAYGIFFVHLVYGYYNCGSRANVGKYMSTLLMFNLTSCGAQAV
jgi:hypothetical protein